MTESGQRGVVQLVLIRWRSKWCSVVRMESRRRNTSARNVSVQQRFVAPEGAVFGTTLLLCIDKENRGARCTFVKSPQ